MSVLAVDIGSSRIKALLAGWDGRLLEVRSAATPRQSSEPGERAYPADAVLETVEDLVQGLASSHPGQRVDTLVFSCLGTAMVPTDADGRPLGPALAPLDARPQAGASVVDALGLGAAELRERTGSDPALPSSLLHLLWWQRQRPGVMERSQRFRSLRGYALAHFCGADAEDPSWASRTMLMDLERGDWSTDILAAAGLAPELLPAIEPSTTAFPLGGPNVERLGLAPAAVAILGAMDNCCSHLGAQGPGRAGLVNIVGTYEHLAGSADLATVRQAAKASGAVVHAYLQPERFIGMTRVPIGELLARAAAGHGGALEALLKAVSVEPRGRSLPLDEAAVDAAIRDGVPGGEVVQALLEAAAAVLGRFADAWEALGRPAEPMAVVGGGAGHAAVTQLKANVLGRTLVTLASEQGAGLGALRLAAMARRGLSEGEASALFAHPVKDTFRPGRRGSTAVSSTQGASVT